MLPRFEEADALQFELFDDLADEIEHIVLIIDIVVFSPHQCKVDRYVVHLPPEFVVLEIDSDDIAHQGHR